MILRISSPSSTNTDSLLELNEWIPYCNNTEASPEIAISATCPPPGAASSPKPFPPVKPLKCTQAGMVPAHSSTASEHPWVYTCVCPKPEQNSFLVILVTQPYSQLLSFRRTIIILLLEECVWEEHLRNRIQPGLTADFSSQGIKACLTSSLCFSLQPPLDVSAAQKPAVLAPVSVLLVFSLSLPFPIWPRFCTAIHSNVFISEL